MRSIKAVALACAAFCVCAAIMLQASAGATAAIKRTPLTYDPATQSHPGACSQSTLNVPQAVSDLSANGILGQYAVLVGVHATGAALSAQMRQTLVVLHVARSTVTANHGCTTDGLIFSVGPRTLTSGETVGVGLPGSIRAKLCTGSTAGCERRVLTEHTVFPTNCWNLDQGNVQVVVYLHKPHAKPKPKPKRRPKPTVKASPKLAKPSARVSTTCGTGNGGTSTVTLANGATASRPASFVVNGKRYGPVAAGKSITVTVSLGSTGNTAITVTSGGDTLVSQQLPADPCPAAAPSAKAALSCSAGGVIVTLSNASTATADAAFVADGTTYGPLAPGASQTITIPVAPGSSKVITVTSAGETLLTGATYSNSCASAASVFAAIYCSPVQGGGGTLAVQLGNATSATLPASFTVSATGNTAAGYGPAAVGPLAAGATQTLLIPVDASGTTVNLTVDSGGVPLWDTPLVPPSACTPPPAE